MNYDALLAHIATLHGPTTGSAAVAVNQALFVRDSVSLLGSPLIAMASGIFATVSRKLQLGREKA